MSLITGLDFIRSRYGKLLKRDAKRVVCLTYTKRAVAVIESRLGWDELFIVSTLHSFLWGEIKRFTPDIRRVLQEIILPSQIEKAKADDDGGKSQKALTAREKIPILEENIKQLENIQKFQYNDSNFTNYTTGELGHNAIIEIAANLIGSNKILQSILGQKYPFIFVDEAQDTHDEVINALNVLCEKQGLPLVGYFGDPMQQIYDKRAGDFKGPPNSQLIPKEENFRCSVAVINLLNAFRDDIEQFPAGKNAEIEGSVVIRLINTEKAELPKNRYSPEQIDRALQKLDQSIADWGWTDKKNVKHLYLVRQMIARRLGFSNLHTLFTGDYASSRAEEEYENGEHFLLKPFITCLFPLIQASHTKNHRAVIDILRSHSATFDPTGKNAKKSLAEMQSLAQSFVSELEEKWKKGNAREILSYSSDVQLCKIPERLSDHLNRLPRNDEYEEEKHSIERSEWLADAFFNMTMPEIERYCEFVSENTIFSTQHGVKGEEYDSVLVVFDDVGSAWNNYNFERMLTPQTAENKPTERQLRLSRHLAYVCFSRAEKDLRIILFSSNANKAKKELVERGLFKETQIEVM